MPRSKVQSLRDCPCLSQAIRTVYNRRKRGKADGDNWLIAMDHIKKILGDIPVNEITTQSVNQIVDALQIRPYHNSNKTINKKVSALKVLLMDMEDDGHLNLIKLPRRLKEEKGRIHFLTEEMEDDLLNTFLSWKLYVHHDFVKCLIDLGCRRGELLGLQKMYIDFQLNQITFAQRKCDNPVSVPMTDTVQQILRPYYLRCKPADKLFPYSEDWITKTWNKVRDYLGFAETKWYVPHICRHTCATRLVQRGVELGIVRDWLGHSNISMTCQYAHFAPKQLHGAVHVLNVKKTTSIVA